MAVTPGMSTNNQPALAIVWHSRTGAARAMADAAADGAGDAARLLAADAVQPEDLLMASGYLFVCPENLGAMCGTMKEMFDRCYFPLLGRIEGRPFATAIAAGTAGQGAEAQIERIVTGWRLRRVAESLIVRLDADTPERILAPKTLTQSDLARCRDLGEAFATGLRLGIF
jgi:NAD(P)H-dependent FMN reductase